MRNKKSYSSLEREHVRKAGWKGAAIGGAIGSGGVSLPGNLVGAWVGRHFAKRAIKKGKKVGFVPVRKSK